MREAGVVVVLGWWLLSLLSCWFVPGCDSAISADLVKSLPGFAGPFPSAQYSGYLSISGGKHLHYWLVASENNQNTDPLAIWFNGGPGCSSLDGFFYEHGPFRIAVDTSTDSKNSSARAPTLSLNPHRWNKIANLLFIEAPAGTGLSYADTAEGNKNNDKQQAIDNFEALQLFYKGFPEYSKRKLFITGESYAGMYVPTLAMQVLAYNKHPTTSVKIPLNGIMVGNGVIGQNTGQIRTKIQTEYLHGRGLYKDATYRQIVRECGNFSVESEKCQEAVTSMHEQVGRVNIYDVAGPCIISDTKSGLWRVSPDLYSDGLASNGQQLIGGPGGRGPVACIDGGAAAAYLNQDTVRKAIHVKSVSEIGEWHVCGGKLEYSENWGSLLPNYKNDIIPEVRVLIYNGDADACVPYNGNEEWTSGLNFPVKNDWHTWQVNNQVAGYATEYDHGFSFVTVRDAGHMVPQFKPSQAFAMFQRFINNQPF